MNSIIEVKENNSNLIEFNLLSGGDFLYTTMNCVWNYQKVLIKYTIQLP